MKGMFVAAMAAGLWIASFATGLAADFSLFSPPPAPAEFHPPFDARPAAPERDGPATATYPTELLPRSPWVAQADPGTDLAPQPLLSGESLESAPPAPGMHGQYQGSQFYQSPIGQGMYEEAPESPMHSAPQVQQDLYGIAPKACYCQDGCGCWTFYADGLYWTRSPSCNIPLVRDGGVPVSGDPAGELARREILLSADDLNFDLTPGWRIGAIKHNLLWGCDLEFLYFGLAPWSSTATVASPTGGQTLLSGPPYLYVSGLPQVVTWESELHNLELNVRRRLSHKTTILGGFRALYLGEEFHAGNVTRSWYNIETQNTLLGAQIGAEHDFWNRGGRLRITGTAKAGLAYNIARAEATDLYGGYFGDRPGVISADGGDLALISEVGLSATYQLSCRWAIRAGYQMLWACGVAMAPCQIDNLDMVGDCPVIPTPGATIYGDQVDMGNRLFTHGGYLGLEFKF